MRSLGRSRDDLPRAGHVFYLVAVTTAPSVTALQMLQVRGGLLTVYGADLFGTAWPYLPHTRHL
ncbi:MAG: hypothetical protein ABJC74_01495 [Gemmatimonadota bacterium]